MKVIDLLNKIANGEEVPKKIKHNRLIYNWDIVGYLHYEDEEDTEKAFLEGYRTDMCLNDEVEIIEEDKEIPISKLYVNNELQYDLKDKKIEKIKKLNNVAGCKELIELEDKQQINNHILKDKINEIIDYINKE